MFDLKCWIRSLDNLKSFCLGKAEKTIQEAKSSKEEEMTKAVEVVSTKKLKGETTEAVATKKLKGETTEAVATKKIAFSLF